MKNLYQLDDLDWEIYLLCNPDLKKNNILTQQQSIKHFKDSGINENRFINTKLLELYNHYDWNIYRNKYSQVKNLSYNNCFFYYIKEGILENHEIELKQKKEPEIINFFMKDKNNLKYYQILNQYNWATYKEKYKLHNLNSDFDAFLHYLDIGIKKKYKPDKNIVNITFFHNTFFQKTNQLRTIKNNYIKNYIFHKKYNIYYTIFEQHLFENYNWNIYILKNNDLNKIFIKEIDGFSHFINYGIPENRNFYENIDLEKKYDWKLYKLQKSLLNKSNYEVINYYIQNGKYKGDFILYQKDINELINTRELNYENFDLDFYINMNNNINLKNIINIQNGFDHYLKVGKYEKCLYNKQQKYIYEHYNFEDFTKKHNLSKSLSKKELTKLYFEKINFYLPKFFILKNNEHKNVNQTLKFSFVISSFNNEKNILDNLVSIILQSYSNWEIIYTNDNSNDKTDEFFHFIVQKYKIEKKVIYIKNDKNMKQAYNKYQMYQKIDKNNIIIILDGDDWLYHSDVLYDLSNIYDKKKCNMTYSRYYYYIKNKLLNKSTLEKIPQKVKQNNNYRDSNWYFNHLRTGYAWLFRMIPEEYLKYNNKWLDRCTDWAEIFCIAELSEGKIEAIEDIQIVYNKNNSLLYNNSYYKDHSSHQRKNIENYIINLKTLSIVYPKIYIINLKNKIELKNSLTKQLEKENIKNYEFFEALNAYENDESEKIYKGYLTKYNKNEIPTKVFGVEKIHINNIGALGIIQSTLKLYKYINQNTKLDHVIILEDDVYFKKNFLKEFHITNIDLKNCDFMYIGHNCRSKDLLKLRNKNKNIIDIKKECSQINIYGAYGFICSRKFRIYVLSKGLSYFVNQNLNLDCFYATLYKDKANDLNIKLYNDHLVIPEVRKDGIQDKRGEEFYNDREMNLNDYNID